MIFSAHIETTTYSVKLEFAENVFGTFMNQPLVVLNEMEVLLYALVGILKSMKIFIAWFPFDL